MSQRKMLAAARLWVYPKTMNRPAHISLRYVLLSLLTVALLSLPFAHRVGAAPVTSDMALFLSAGGEIADICGDTGTHMAGGCESCRTVEAMLLAQCGGMMRAMPLPKKLNAQRFVHSLAVPVLAQSTPPVRAPPRA